MSCLKTLKQVFFVRSLEPFCCPSCQCEHCSVIGSRNRKVIEAFDTSRSKTFRIRRLKCSSCGRIHHELPGTVIPYKRHPAESIEAVLDDTEVAVEESTIRRWKAWFNGITCHLLGVLNTMSEDNTMEKTPFPGTPLQRLRQSVGETTGWLSRVVHQTVKLNLWVQTRSAFSAG
ncbi:DUF6431 domain-containing protein [Youngiibacter fragilis]|uniref:DUF6431 domain-containing protein n=1 Tax=Youngiibacter fragilis TaxID=1408819 RepID=UPI0034E0A034